MASQRRPMGADLTSPAEGRAWCVWQSLQRYRGHPPLPRHRNTTYDLSDEGLCDRWVEDPYLQCFCGKEFLQHRLPATAPLSAGVSAWGKTSFWRCCMGAWRPDPALKPSDLARVVADTTHCAAEVMFPTDATGEDLAGMLVKAMLRITIGLRGTAIA